MTAITAAERILLDPRDHRITDPKEIDLDAIAWDRGAAVNYRPLDRCEATIVGSNRRAAITVNSRSSPERQRFWVGHELGHWHHHRGRILFCGKKEVENPPQPAHDRATRSAWRQIAAKAIKIQLRPDPLAR